jgi:hypothetical protein
MTNDRRRKIEAQAQEIRSKNPSQRYGQAIFNAAYSLYPELADQLRGGSVDPFYQNENVTLFLQEMSQSDGVCHRMEKPSEGSSGSRLSDE